VEHEHDDHESVDEAPKQQTPVEREEFLQKTLREINSKVSGREEDARAMIREGGPLLAAIEMVKDEAKAWDQYALMLMRCVEGPKSSDLPTEVVSMVGEGADKLLAERCKRFNARSISERMDEILEVQRKIGSRS